MRAAMKRNPWPLIFTAIAVGLIGCAVSLTRPLPSRPTVVRAPAPPAAPVAPVAKVLTIVGGPRVPHATHLDLGLECADCHEMGESGPGYPEADFCLDCHEDMQEDLPEAEKIQNLFWTEDGRPTWQKAIQGYDPAIVFAHARHEKVECADCHDMSSQQRVSRTMFTMDDCMSCHQQRGAPLACAVCHPSIRDDVAPLSHQMAWETRHGALVRQSQATGEASNCHYCHQQPNFCNDCHQGKLPTSHYGDWEHLHGQRVLSSGGPGEARCTFCHVQQNFCDDCHMNVQPTSHKHLWVRRHGAFTRAQDVSTTAKCEFCHHNPAFCEDCHRVTEPRDHTTLFRTRTHGVVVAMDRTRCTICHQTDFCVRCHEETAPRSHRGMWARTRNTHCITCHFPITSNPNCRVCHRTNPTHDSAPSIPAIHPPGLNCRICHNVAGGGGAPPLRHIDNGQPCQSCHQ